MGHMAHIGGGEVRTLFWCGNLRAETTGRAQE